MPVVVRDDLAARVHGTSSNQIACVLCETDLEQLSAAVEDLGIDLRVMLTLPAPAASLQSGCNSSWSNG